MYCFSKFIGHRGFALSVLLAMLQVGSHAWLVSVRAADEPLAAPTGNTSQPFFTAPTGGAPTGLNQSPLLNRSRQYEAYTLGAGDRIQIDIFNVPEFSGPNGVHEVLVDGTLNLPFVGTVDVQGMTLATATDTLKARYAALLTRPPALTVTLLNPRPLRIAVSGEVNRPGTYTIPLAETGDQGQKWPSLTEVLQKAGGITQLADVRDIQIHRPQRHQSDAVLTANLWDLIQSGEMGQDVNLRDGDTIVVPKAVSLRPDESIRIASANFSPDSMNVQVVGEVNRPGAVTVPPNTSLNQAILNARGL